MNILFLLLAIALFIALVLKKCSHRHRHDPVLYLSLADTADGLV